MSKDSIHPRRKYRLTLNDYHELAEKCGFKYLGIEAPLSNMPSSWQCSNNHTWNASYSNIRSGWGCPHCSGKFPKTPQDYHNLASEHGFKWIGTDTRSILTKTTWQCSQGHVWQSRYNDIHTGYGCPYCAGNVRKTAADYHSLANHIGYKWIGDFPKTTLKLTLWECPSGHKFKMGYATLNYGIRCPHCAGNAKKTEQDYHDIATKIGYKWIGLSFPQNVMTKTEWECTKGHTYHARYNDLQSGYRCPLCLDFVNGKPVSKQQRKLHKMIGGILNHPVGAYCIDIAFIETMICVEYDSARYHNKAHDDKRDSLLINQGWKVLRIKSGKLLPSLEQIQNALDILQSGSSYTEIVLSDWIL